MPRPERARRTFRPTIDGYLEPRIALAAVPAAAVSASATASTETGTPQSIAIRQRYINRLGNLLESLQPGRFVPPAAVESLQAALLGVRSRLNAPNRGASLQFQRYLRLTISDVSINPEHAAGLSATFFKILESMGASQQQRDAFVPGLTLLVKAASNGRNPSELMANDFGLIFQALQTVGKPLPPPARPTLASKDDTGPKGDRTTSNRQPHLTGTYAEGFQIQLLDQNGTIIGISNTDSNGRYSVQPWSPLALGTVKLRVRAVQLDAGDPSRISAALAIRVIKPPQHAGKA